MKSNITLDAALQLGIEASSGDKPHKNTLKTTARLALNYFSKHHGIQLINEIEDMHIAQYLENMQERGLEPATQRHYLIPLRLAHTATKWKTGQKIDFEHLPVPKRVYKPANFIPAVDMFRVLDTVRAFERWRSFACLSAGFMAGLRISEFNRLSPDKLNGDELEISGETKNLSSRRVIPIPKALVSILHDWFGRREESLPDVRNLGKQIRISLDLSFESLCIEGSVEPREAGRKSFMQWASAMDINENAVRAYAGHSLVLNGGDTLHSAYQYNAPPRPEQTQAQRHGPMQKLREMVLAPIEDAIKVSKFRV